MLEKIKALLRSDDTVNSLSVFPEIDQNKIAQEFKLADEGRTRGASDLPGADSVLLDSVESKVVARISDLRDRGLENYETNRQIYNERLNRASSVRSEVEIIAGTASTDYTKAVRGWTAAMTSAKNRLHDSFQYREAFRSEHSLIRPAKIFGGWFALITFTIIMIVCEAGMNAFMFSRGNEQGLLGGMLTAVMFSALNVVASMLLGIWATGLNHTYFIRKFLGAMAMAFWLAFMLALNFIVAHFRNLIDAEVPWEEAILLAVPAAVESPLAMQSMDSWFLVSIGALISVFAFMKGWHTFDPFPGYGKIERDLEYARSGYIAGLEEAYDDLTDKRDEAISNLRDIDRQVTDSIGEAIDALYGHSTLNANLKNFLGQCDLKANNLLAVYRDANLTARKAPAPATFNAPFSFPEINEGRLEDESRRITAQSESKAITRRIENEIENIFSAFRHAIISFQMPEDIQERLSLPQFQLPPDPVRSVEPEPEAVTPSTVDAPSPRKKRAPSAKRSRKSPLQDQAGDVSTDHTQLSLKVYPVAQQAESEG